VDRAALFYHVSVSDKGGTVLWEHTRSALVPSTVRPGLSRELEPGRFRGRGRAQSS